MKQRFVNKVVWITGASSGIGEALVYAFNKAGANIIISARNVEALLNVKNTCVYPEHVFVLPMDLSKAGEICHRANEGFSRWGRIDYMIHNAGVAARDKVEDISENVDRMVMETNYFGPVILTKALLPKMLEAGNGHFVVVTSMSGEYGVPKLSAYAASKHALHGFFESLRAETIGSGINITMVIPGFIKTHIITNGTDGKGRERMRDLEVNSKGMEPLTCAQKILKAIKAKKEECLVGNVEVLSIYVNRLFPSLFRKIVRNHPMRLMKQFKEFFSLLPNIPVGLTTKQTL
jgi:dehydrogenase/reductase SDR family member 7B